MNEKEKAMELVDKFKEYANDDYLDSKYQHELNETRLKNAKQCAIICVEEILKQIKNWGIVSVEVYWNNVKTEINNL